MKTKMRLFTCLILIMMLFLLNIIPAAANGQPHLKPCHILDDGIDYVIETDNVLTANFALTEPSPVTVMVRVEGWTSTIWCGEVTFSNSSITDEEGTAHSIGYPSALGALDEASKAGGFNYIVTSSLYVREVAGEIEDTTDPRFPGWLYRVNWAGPWVGAADYELSNGDEVLWYYGCFDPVTFAPPPPLKLTADNTIIPSTDNFTATIEYYDDNASSFISLADATVHAGSRIYTTDTSGQVNISLPPGVYNVYADKGDYTQYTRSNSETVIIYVTLTLYPGWNFISLPKKLISDNHTAAEVFAGVDTGGHSIFYYTSSGWVAMNVDSPINPLEGIWIFSTTTKELHPQFDSNPRQAPPAEQLSAGWNAIGFSDFTVAPANSTLISVEEEWSILIGYDSINQTYEPSIINDDITGGPHDESGLMYPWKGYWLYMNSAGELAGISL